MFCRGEFDEDRLVGEDFEERFKAAVERDHPSKYFFVKHENCSGDKWHCKCYDLENCTNTLSLRGEPITVECKHDFKAQHTGNIVFETYLYKGDKLKATYWVHELMQDKALLFRVDDLRTYIPVFLTNRELAIELHGGDGKRTEMALIKDVKHFISHVPHRKVVLNQPIPDNIFF